MFCRIRRKIKQTDGRIERKQESLSDAVGYVETKKLYFATKEDYATTKKQNEEQDLSTSRQRHLRRDESKKC